MHTWGDAGVDWEGISDAAHWIGENLVRWGRVNVTSSKEKYGTARVYCYFGWHQMCNITHPGFAFSRYPKWLWDFDCNYMTQVVPPLNFIVVPYQKWLYRRVYAAALKKWPHLAGEIIMGADWYELLIGLDQRLVIEVDEYGTRVIDWVDNKQTRE